MLRRLACVAAVALTVIGVAAAPANAGIPRPSYYLALGDSLAYGYQPTHITGQGYVDDLYANLRRNDANLQLNNLGCPGETSGTMISGGICSYPQGNQLDAAVHFLRSHPLRVKLVTIDIGANDVDRCLSGGTIDQTCINDGLQAIARNLTKTVVRLRQAAPFVKIVGMNYYDPFLAAYLQGPNGPALAQQSLTLADALNNELASIYQLGGFKVADVAGAFATDDFTTPVTLASGVTVPLDVARICQWTWMCISPPGPDIHANPDGYLVMARAFADQL